MPGLARLTARLTARPLGHLLGRPVVLLLGLAACQPVLERRFVLPTNAPSSTGLVRTASGALVGNEAGRLIHLNESGAILWTLALKAEVVVPPVVSGTQAIATSAGGEWLAVDLPSGEVRWRRVESEVAIAAPQAEGEYVYILARGGEVLALSVESGATVWRRRFSGPLGEAPPFAVAGERALLATKDELLAFHLADGAPAWTRPWPEVAGLQTLGTRSIVLTRRGNVRALTTLDGGVLWSRDLGGDVQGGPWLAASGVWVALADGTLIALSPETGAERRRIRTGELVLAAPVETSSGYLIVASARHRGRLLAFLPNHARPSGHVSVDSPLRSAPLEVREQLLLVAAADGRVLGFRVARAPSFVGTLPAPAEGDPDVADGLPLGRR